MTRSAWTLFFLVLCLSLLDSPLSHAASWKEDFERICSYADDVTELDPANLTALISESDQLLKAIEALGDPQKKVYIFRLKKCRNFFQYMLDLKASETDPASQEAPRQ